VIGGCTGPKYEEGEGKKHLPGNFFFGSRGTVPSAEFWSGEQARMRKRVSNNSESKDR